MRILAFSLQEMDKTLPRILCWFIFGFYKLSSVYGNEVEALTALKAQLHDSSVLQSWDPALAIPCTWFHVTCDNENNVIRIDLGNAGLSGQLVPELGQLTNLQYLELYSNNITGKIPYELGNLTNLVSLDLYLNQLDGDIPDTLGKLHKLRYLRLGNNNLTGTIPLSLTLMMSLLVIDLSNNFLTGDVPFNGSFSLFTPISFANNPQLSAPQLSVIQHVPEAPRQYPLQSPPKSQSFSVGSNDIRAILEGFVVGLALVFSGRTIALAWRLCIKTQDHFTDVPAEEDPKVHHGQLRRFSLHELQVATDGFSSKNILGLGAFSKVYKGRLADGSLVAVKRIRDHVQSRELQFQTEVELFSMIVHKNLLWLQGFCMTLTERLLVYPFMVNGSVASCLRDHHLDWPTRKRIALGSARGLAYLHDHCDPKIIHRDVKAANILLDQEFEAVVGDFSIANLMNSKDADVTTVVHGTIGHIAPEYLSTGKSSEKTDVFGYGVMLLELITGKRAYDLADIANDNGVMLLDWVQGLLRDKKLEVVVDVDLEFNYMRDIVEELIQIALLCTQVVPSQRPKMLEIVKMFEGDGLATESLEEE